MGKVADILTTCKRFLDPISESKKLLEEIEGQKVRMEQLKKEFIDTQYWKLQYTSLLNTITESMEALVWCKDEFNQYTLANPNHCSEFFNLSYDQECLDYIKGKTDIELITDIYRNNNINNTFGEICGLTDDYTIQEGKMCHFFEAGVVDQEAILLYIIKIPQYENGKIKGTVGIGWNFSDQSEFIMRHLQRWDYENKVNELHKSDCVFAYKVRIETKRCDIFNHFCPKC